MVATRKSISTADSASTNAFVLPASTGDKKKDRLLRQLQTDGEFSFSNKKKDGGKKASSIDQGKGVYHWRGAVYAITDDTPQEWIDAEPQRFKEQKKDVVPPAPASVPRKRRADDDEDDEDNGDNGAVVPAKKVRRSMPEMRSRAQREEAGTWPKKTRSPGPNREKQRETERDCAEPSRPKTDLELQKENAKDRGLEVDMLPEITAKKPKPKAKKSTSKVVKKTKKQAAPKRLSILEQLAGKIEAKKLAFDVAKMAKLNTRIADVSEKIQTAEDKDGKLEPLKQRLKVPSPTNDEMYETEPAQQQPTPETDQSSQRLDQEADEPASRKVSSSTTPSLTPDDTPASSISFASNGPITLAPRSSPDIPPMDERNRGGQKLRWSLNKSEILKNTDRAENAIQKSRLEGESKAARRRRVKREIEFVKGLPVSFGEEGEGRANSV